MAIAFRAKLWSPMEGKGSSFVTMPKSASSQLPARGRVAVEGTVNGFQLAAVGRADHIGEEGRDTLS